MAVSVPGIGSNLDVDGIVSQLMALERQPLATLTQRETRYTAQISAYGRLKGALGALQTAADALAKLGESTFKLTSTAAATVSGSAGSGAEPGTHSVSVSQLASAQRLVAQGQSSRTAAIGDGSATTLTIAFGRIGGGTFNAGTGTYTGASFTPNPERVPINIELNASNNSLEGIRDAINAAGGNVSASIVNDGGASPYRLSIVSKDTGADYSLKVSVAGSPAIAGLLAYDPAGTQNLVQTQAANDAQLNIDGIAVSSASNSLSGALEGVTLQLRQTGSASVTIGRDDSTLRAALDGFVNAYNETNGIIAQITGLKAVLQGDASTLGVQHQLRGAVGAALGTDTGAYRTLSALGVSFQRDGSLKMDGAKFDAALDADPAAVRGFATAFGAGLKSLADLLLAGDSAVQAKTNGLNRSIEDIAGQRDTMERRLEAIEKRYRTQFAALDALLGSLQQTSNYLQQQLANLPKTNQT